MTLHNPHLKRIDNLVELYCSSCGIARHGRHIYWKDDEGLSCKARLTITFDPKPKAILTIVNNRCGRKMSKIKRGTTIDITPHLELNAKMLYRAKIDPRKNTWYAL